MDNIHRIRAYSTNALKVHRCLRLGPDWYGGGYGGSCRCFAYNPVKFWNLRKLTWNDRILFGKPFVLANLFLIEYFLLSCLCYSTELKKKEWIYRIFSKYIQWLVQYELVISNLAITRKNVQLVWENYNLKKLFGITAFRYLCVCAELWTTLPWEHNFFLPQPRHLLGLLFSLLISTVFSYQYPASYYFFHLNSTYISFVRREKKVSHFKQPLFSLFSVWMPYPLPSHLTEVLGSGLCSLGHSFFTRNPKWIVVFCKSTFAQPSFS